MSRHPVIRLLPGRHKRVRHGHPWVYSNEVVMDTAAKALPPGNLVTLESADGHALGTAFFSPHSLIAARVLSTEPNCDVDAAFLAARLGRALELREALFREPHYRLVHAEADGLPGLVIDRYGDVLACQLNAAGMERLTGPLIEAIERTVAPSVIVLRNDSAARAIEGLPIEVKVVKGQLSEPVELLENGCRFVADLLGGQKTGWFFDQRDNRAFMAELSRGRRVLDLFCYSGGFTVQAAVAGANNVLAVDSSEAALALAAEAAVRNRVGDICRFERGQVFEVMARLANAGEHFDVVICDPPAFVKSKRDVVTGAKGYRKLARLAAQLTAPEGFVFLASCSHNMEMERFTEEMRRGFEQAGRTGTIVRSAGAAPDHPVHPYLPESAYLKALVLRLE